ncbi:hypothetical protein [Aquimarina sp. LLG6339-5]|uniref:hypothetical protein n=1 Tax=Aquimarina sp. LLG6339-5 TaxID=3160830 RepID=UPI00386FEA60
MDNVIITKKRTKTSIVKRDLLLLMSWLIFMYCSTINSSGTDRYVLVESNTPIIKGRKFRTILNLNLVVFNKDFEYNHNITLSNNNRFWSNINKIGYFNAISESFNRKKTSLTVQNTLIKTAILVEISL